MHSKTSNLHSFLCTLFILLLLLLNGCGNNAKTEDTAQKLTPFIVQTDWYAQPEHGGIYQALAKGYYEEVGLAVEVREGANIGTIPQLVAAGRVDIAMSRSDAVIVAASRGIPLVCIAAHMQHDPQGIIFHEESGIQSFSDLQGKDVMISPGAAMIDILKKIYKIDFNLIPMDWGLTQFLQDKQFVQQCFITSEPYYVKQKGANPKTILLSETGFDPYRVFYTNKKNIEKKSEDLRKFIAATNKGWASFFEEEYPEALVEISKRNPKITEDFARWTIQVMKENHLVEGYADRGESTGHLNKDRFQKNIDLLEKIGLLEEPIALREVMSEQFLSP